MYNNSLLHENESRIYPQLALYSDVCLFVCCLTAQYRKAISAKKRLRCIVMNTEHAIGL